MKDAVVLVFANKQDQRDGTLSYFTPFEILFDCCILMAIFILLIAMKPEQLQERLGLHTLKDRTWYIQPCSATKGNLAEPLFPHKLA